MIITFLGAAAVGDWQGNSLPKTEPITAMGITEWL